MRLAIDINHPAHVHFFKNFIREMEKRGHECLVTAMEKEIACLLLDQYGISYINHGPIRRSLIGKLLSVPALELNLYRSVRRFKPDVFLGLASFRAAHIASLLRKKSVIFDDTETGKAEVLLYKPFADYICTPSCYKRDLGKKHVRYAGYHELAYLHPNRFIPDPSILNAHHLTEQDRFVVMRFVGWQAVHDIGQSGLTLENKRKAVAAFSEHANVLITSERPLPPDLEPYRIRIPPEEIHHVLAYATLLFGESGTMATECALLGTPSIIVNNAVLGNMIELEQTYDCMYQFSEAPEDQDKSIQKGLEILNTPGVKQVWQKKRERLLNDKIDVTQWMMELVEGVCG